MEEATDYSEARKWMEDHLQGLENLVSSTDEDKSSSRRLAVVLLTIREYYCIGYANIGSIREIFKNGRKMKKKLKYCYLLCFKYRN